MISCESSYVSSALFDDVLLTLVFLVAAWLLFHSHHNWKYRMHIPVEVLVKSEEFNTKLRDLASRSGRNNFYS